jgi:hypothetical protein
MPRGRAVLSVVAGLVVLIAGGTVIASDRGPRPTHRFTVIEHATTDTVIDVGDQGDSTGDLLTFHNEVYDRSDSRRVGTDQGDCVRIDPTAGTWECRWVTMLRDGQITVEGPFSDVGDTILAVTGGTGVYRNTRGEMHLRSLEGGSKFAFAFSLIG